MSSTQASKNTLSFDIKSTLLPLESVIIRSNNLSQVIADLKSRFSKHPDFFDNDPIMIDLTQIGEEQDNPSLDVSVLYQELKQHKMNPVALRSKNPNHQAWAELAGLFLVTDAQIGQPMKSKAIDPKSAPVNKDTSQQTMNDKIVGNPTQSNEAIPKQVVLEAPHATSALVVDKPLRSGQHVYAKGRDLIVMAMVNAGAEIMADGHIHVYAPLRGKAIAGARGNKEARIYTTCLEAELISIAGVYRTSDNPIPREVAGKSAQIRLIDDKLVMQPN